MANKLKSKGFKPVGVDGLGARTPITLDIFQSKKEAWKSIEEGTYKWGADFEVVEILELVEEGTTNVPNA